MNLSTSDGEDIRVRYKLNTRARMSVLEFVVPPRYDHGRPTREAYGVAGGRKVVGEFADVRARLDFGYHGCYTEERQQLQDTIIGDCIGDGVPHDSPWAIFTAGAMGAGKGHTIEWMSYEGHFAIPDCVHVDPDAFRGDLPEWRGYVDHDGEQAGAMTHREAGYMVEIAQEAAMRQSKNVWIDGSLRDSVWYEQVFMDIRKRHPQYRIAIVHVFAPWEVVKARAESRAALTGRTVPLQQLCDSFNAVPKSVASLAPRTDFCAHVENLDEPRLTATAVGAEESINCCGSWDEVRERFSLSCGLLTAERVGRFVRQLIRDHQVIVFSKSYSSVGRKTHKLLQQTVQDVACRQPLDSVGSRNALEVRVLDMDTIALASQRNRGSAGSFDPGADISSIPGASGVCVQMELTRMTRSNIVPQVFINGEFVGGWEAIKKLNEEGQLAEMLTLAVARSSSRHRTSRALRSCVPALCSAWERSFRGKFVKSRDEEAKPVVCTASLQNVRADDSKKVSKCCSLSMISTAIPEDPSKPRFAAELATSGGSWAEDDVILAAVERSCV